MLYFLYKVYNVQFLLFNSDVSFTEVIVYCCVELGNIISVYLIFVLPIYMHEGNIGNNSEYRLMLSSSIPSLTVTSMVKHVN